MLDTSEVESFISREFIRNCSVIMQRELEYLGAPSDVRQMFFGGNKNDAKFFNEKKLINLKRDKIRFKATNYDKNGEIFCSKCGHKKLAKIKLTDTGFGRSLDPEDKGYFMAVCECKCVLSKKEIRQN